MRDQPAPEVATAHLRTACPAFGPLIDRAPPPPPPGPPQEPFQALLRAITHQQLHGRAARAIHARLLGLLPDPPTPSALLALTEAALRGCGLSARKVTAVREVGLRTLDGTVPGLSEAQSMSDAALIERLDAVRGVGRWTVEMLLIDALARPDVLPVDDFGVREGWRRLAGLEQRPGPKALAAIGAAWAPYRSTAAWYLWRAADG